MQKLTAIPRAVRRACTGTNGSALVGVITLCTIMAIAGAGFLQVSSTAVNNETAALEEARAFWAAESGLQLAAKEYSNEKRLPPPPDIVFGPIGIAGTNIIDSVIHKNVQPNHITYTVLAFAFKGDLLDTNSFLKSIKAKLRMQRPRNYGDPVEIIDWEEQNTLN
jgi:hypothetical protein